MPYMLECPECERMTVADPRCEEPVCQNCGEQFLDQDFDPPQTAEELFGGQWQ